MRYNRLKDIGLTDQQIKDNLLFSTDRVGDNMKVAMDPVLAKDWFGKNPPDLTLMARSRSGHGGTGADLKSTKINYASLEQALGSVKYKVNEAFKINSKISAIKVGLTYYL
jgi:cytochrome c1